MDYSVGSINFHMIVYHEFDRISGTDPAIIYGPGPTFSIDFQGLKAKNRLFLCGSIFLFDSTSLVLLSNLKHNLK